MTETQRRPVVLVPGKPVFQTVWARCPVCGHHAHIVAGIGICPVCDGE